LSEGGSRPPLELDDRDAELLGLVGEVFLDAIAREDEDAHGQHVQHGVVAFEGRGLGVLGTVGLEGDLGHAAGLGPFGGDEFGALGAATVEKDHVGILGPDLIQLAPDQAVIVEVGPSGEGHLGACGQHHLGLGAALSGEVIAAVDQRGGQVLVVHHRAGAGPPSRARVVPELGGGVIAHHVHAVPPFGQGQALGHQALKLGGFHLGAVLLSLEATLPLFVVIEIALDPGGRAVEEIDLAPEHLFEVGFHAGVGEARDEGVEDIGDGTPEAVGIRHRARIGLVFEGTVAVELQLFQRMGGLGRGVGGLIAVVAGLERHLLLASGLLAVRAFFRAAFMGCESRHGGRPFTRAFAGRNACGGGRGAADLVRDAKRGLDPRGGNQLPPVLEGSAPLTAACPSLEGRAGNAGIDWP
jgi:hypothetical protein